MESRVDRSARYRAAGADRATLCTLTADGYPYGSAISFSLDDDGSAVFLMSEMAEHTVNANAEPKASVLIAADPTPGADPLSAARLTLVGRLAKLADPGESRERYTGRRVIRHGSSGGGGMDGRAPAAMMRR